MQLLNEEFGSDYNCDTPRESVFATRPSTAQADGDAAPANGTLLLDVLHGADLPESCSEDISYRFALCAEIERHINLCRSASYQGSSFNASWASDC